MPLTSAVSPLTGFKKLPVKPLLLAYNQTIGFATQFRKGNLGLIAPRIGILLNARSKRRTVYTPANFFRIF